MKTILKLSILVAVLAAPLQASAQESSKMTAGKPAARYWLGDSLNRLSLLLPASHRVGAAQKK